MASTSASTCRWPFEPRPLLQIGRAVARLGRGREIRSSAFLRDPRPGGCPGPGRPYAEAHRADRRLGALTTGLWFPGSPPVDFGDPVIGSPPRTLSLRPVAGPGLGVVDRRPRGAACPDTARARPSSSLLLNIWAGGHLAASRQRAEMRVAVRAGKKLAIRLRRRPPPGRGRGLLVLPAGPFVRRSRLELVLRTPAPALPGQPWHG